VRTVGPIIGWLILVSGCTGGGISLGSRLSGRYDGVSDFQDVSMEIQITSGDEVRVALERPTAEKITRLSVRRYEGTNCESKSDSEGTLISEDPKASSWVDTSSSPAQSYCYKAFIFDARGQLVTRTVVKPALVDPTVGILEFEDFAERQIVLKHQAPKFDGYEGVELRRYAGEDCSKAAPSAGKLMPLGKDSLSLADDDIQLGRAYCYKIFWYSRLGGFASSHLAYPLFEPGTLMIKDIQAQRIDLSITPAKKADFVSFELRRFTSLTCELQDPSLGTLLTSDNNATEIKDENLELETPYCYRATWRDRIGNKHQSISVYKAVPPRSGSVSISGISSRTLTLTYVHSPDGAAARGVLKRYTEASCQQKKPSEGIDVLVTPSSAAVSDTSLALSTPYCYRAFWFDAFGNYSASTTPQSYAGSGPTGGQLGLGSYGTSPPRITLAHVAPTSANYASVDLRRYGASDCSTQTSPTGVALVPFGVQDGTFADSGLSLGTAYCYRVFWYDSFGNVSSQHWNPAIVFGNGSISISSLEPGKINLAIDSNLTETAPNFQLRRFLSASCATTDPTLGTLLSADGTITSFLDSGVSAAQDYCYRAIWSDQIGNTMDSFAAYSRSGPSAGSISIANVGSRSLTLDISPSAGPFLDRVVLRRYTEAPCTTKGPTDGTDIPVSNTATSVVDNQNLQLGTSYCYGAFWFDGLGNYSSAYTTTPYLGSGPAAGSIEISQYNIQSITLSHSPSTTPQPLYDHVLLKRYAQASCASASSTAGTAVTLSATQISVTDSGLAFGTPYCYKAFWYDAFGNQSSAAVSSPYTMQLPQGGDIQIASMTDQTINLGITPPTNPEYHSVILRRFDQSSCADGALDDGLNRDLDKQATSWSDSGLSLNTPYCYKIFWRDAFGNSSSDTVSYDGQAPSAGGLSISHLTNRTVHLAVTQPSDARFKRFILERHVASSCSSAGRGTGYPLVVTTSTTSLSDSSLSLDTAYCYRAFWLDDFGNLSSATVAYSGTGPQGGELRATGKSHDSIAFDLTLPTTPHYKDFELRRYSGDSCSSAAQSTGAIASSGTSATHVLDTGLAADTQYCYKIFWADTFGNSSSQLTSSQSVPTRTVAQMDTNCVSYSPSQQSTYIAGTYNQHPAVSQSVTIGAPCAAPNSWEDAGVDEAKPAFLSTNWSSGSTFLFSGTFAPDGRHQVSSTPLLYDWSINIDGNKNVAMPPLRIVDGASTTYETPSDIALSDHAAATASGSATLHNLYDGNQVTLKYLTGNAGQDVTSTLGQVPFGTDTDIPGLSYVASGSGAGPYMVGTTSSYSARVAQGGFNLFWDYGPLDQGDYFIRTKPFLQIDGAYVYGAAASTKVTLSDVGGESILTSGTDIGHSEYFGSSREDYLPSLSIGRETINASMAAIHGLIYAARNENRRQYIGSAFMQHSATSPVFLSKNFGSDEREEVTTTSGVNSAHMGIVSIPPEADGVSSRWLTIGNENTGTSATMLVLSAWNFQDNNISSQALTRQSRFELKNQPPDIEYSTRFGAFGLSEAYLDKGLGDGVWRHGLAFFAKDNSSSTGKMYLTTLRSKPLLSSSDPEDYSIKVSRYFDQVAYPNAGDTSPKQHIPSIEIATGVPNTTQFVRIVSQDESVNGLTETFFYVGWRTGDTADSSMKVHLARISTHLGHLISPLNTSWPSMDLMNSEKPGQAYFTLAAGTDEGGSPLLAVAFAPLSPGDTNKCGLRIYRWDSTNLLPMGSDLVIGNDTSGKLCVYPTIFFERSNKVFHVLTTKMNNDPLEAEAVTHYKKFAIKMTGNQPSFVPEIPVDVSVTQSLADQVLCGFTAAFKESDTADMGSRLSWVRVEGSGFCGKDNGQLRFDTYKVQR
jgi:uncharacterized protein YcfL